MNGGESTTRSFPGIQPLASPPGGASGSSTGSRSGGSWWRSHTVLSPAERQLARVRLAVLATLIGLGVLVAARLWFVDGLLRTVRIEGPSMASALDGAHYRVTCDDCRFPFRCDAHAVPSSGEVVCPNCGYRNNKLERAALQAGDEVLIDRWPHVWKAPRRGELVAARMPDSPDDLVVKRVAALPGETLAIQGGDLYANGQLVRKTPAEWRATRVLVHDNNYQPQRTKDLPARWQGSADGSGWTAEGTGFRYANDKGGDLGWAACQLSFAPWHCTAKRGRTEIVSILDNDAYNQASNHNLNVVPDFGLSCKLESKNDPIAIVLDDGRDVFRIALDFHNKQATLAIRESPVLTDTLAAPFAGGPVEVEAALCDQQVFLIVGGRTIFQHPFDRTVRKGRMSDPYEACQPLMIATATTGQVHLTDLRVWRDIYHLHPLELDRPWQADAPLPPGQYALLGDNPPVSIDSRNWPTPGIGQNAILGRVQRPFWSTP